MNNTSIKLLFCILVSLQGVLFSQNETQKWYFGNKAGLDFSTTPPTILTNGAMNTSEGCATISDGSGNLLFYTDGSTVYDKTHVAMANGTGLLGFSSSSQSGIIVKQPGNANIYFVFTQGATTNGLRYSIVDMSLAAGMGSVTVKNVTLSIPGSEKLTSVRHCNGIDVWVVTHDNTGNNYLSFLVTSAGINPTPVISSVGMIYAGADFIGCLKLSPNGKRIACGLYGASAAFEVCDFDNVTGVVSNPLTLGSALSVAYGCEFSPDGTKLYGTRFSNPIIYQWDLCAGSTTAIAASQYTVVSAAPGKGQLQLGSDGKIYVARYQQQDLGVINNPNVAGAGCNYVDLGQSIAPKISTLGLPNFINSFFKPVPLPFTYTTSCESVSFTAPPLQGTVSAGCSSVTNSVTGIAWIFGEPGSGASNSSTVTNPTHTYSTTGTYPVQLVLYSACSSDTIKLPVTLAGLTPTLGVAGTFTICKGEKRIYTVSGASSYTWSSGLHTTTVTLSPTVTTNYSVSGSGANSCKGNQTFTITVNKCTGVEQITGDENIFKMYPNPASGNLVIESSSRIKIMIRNLTGEVMLEDFYESGKHNIDISYFRNGIYTLQTIRGKEVKTIRLIKMD